MSGWLIIGVGVVYAIISVEQFYKGNGGMGICFGAYAVANLGLWVASS